MRVISRFVFVLVGAVVAGCESAPPTELSSGLRVSPLLEQRRPADIAVLPIANASGNLGFDRLTDTARAEVESGLRARRYAPLSPTFVDDRLVAVDAGKGSPVDPQWVGSVRTAFDAEAVLGLRVTRWDDRDVLAGSPRVRFTIEVLMVTSADGRELWGGVLEGSVRPGGEGTAGLTRDGRLKDCAKQMIEALLGQLPERVPGSGSGGGS